MHAVMPILTSKRPNRFTIDTYQRIGLSVLHNDTTTTTRKTKDDVEEFDRNRLRATETAVASLFHLQTGTGT